MNAGAFRRPSKGGRLPRAAACRKSGRLDAAGLGLANEVLEHYLEQIQACFQNAQLSSRKGTCPLMRSADRRHGNEA